MDWNDMRRQWRAAPEAALPRERLIAEVEARDRKLRGIVRRRDWLETGVAVAIAPVFAWQAWRLAERAEWVGFVFCALIVAWIGFVPIKLWHARRALPTPRHDAPLAEYLDAERGAMLLQARMLEQAWLWYFAPFMVGIAGLVFSISGVNLKTVLYTGSIAVFCVVMSYVNRIAARTAFRDHADAIARQINELDGEST